MMTMQEEDFSRDDLGDHEDRDVDDLCLMNSTLMNPSTMMKELICRCGGMIVSRCSWRRNPESGLSCETKLPLGSSDVLIVPVKSVMSLVLTVIMISSRWWLMVGLVMVAKQDAMRRLFLMTFEP